MKEHDKRMAKIDKVLVMVRAEIERAIRKHAPMHSPHEGHSVIAEELDELWDEVKADRGRQKSGFRRGCPDSSDGDSVRRRPRHLALIIPAILIQRAESLTSGGTVVGLRSL